MAESAKRLITAEDLYRFQLITACELSPDGRHVVLSVQRVEAKTERKYTNLWLAPTDGSPARQFTYGDQTDHRPQWSPDSRLIAFLSNRKDERQPQLYIIPIDGGEARPLTDLKGSIESLRWSPDGRRFVCVFRRKDPEELEREADEQKKRLGVVARHITRVAHKADGRGFLPLERLHLWLIDAKTGEAHPLTDGETHDEIGPTWSPDGQAIVFCSNRSADPDLQPEAIDLFAIPPTAQPGDESTWRKIETPYGGRFPVSSKMPSFSPDGQWLAYLETEERGDLREHIHLWIVPFDGSRPAHNLTKEFDRRLEHRTLGDLGIRDRQRPAWSADGRTIYFQVSHHGRTSLNAISLNAISLDAATPDLQTIIGDEGVVGPFGFDQAHEKLAYFYAGMDDPGQIRLRSMADGATQPLTHFNEGWLAEVDLGQVEEVWFKGGAGNDLQGWILKPPDFDPARKYPSILEIHGGPLLQYGYTFMHEFYFLAAHGYVVYFSNPRGSIGYGEEHAKAIRNDWGNADYVDLMAWADYAARLPYIDEERMGVTGGSYGGFMTNWIIGHTDRFRAAVTQRSVSNFISFFGSSDMNYHSQALFGADGYPWEEWDNYWRQSPLKYIANARTPTLIIHCDNDQLVPIEQGEQLFVALKVLGVDTELVRFPDEWHGLSVDGRTDRRIVRLKHILRWFDRYLKYNASTGQ